MMKAPAGSKASPASSPGKAAGKATAPAGEAKPAPKAAAKPMSTARKTEAPMKAEAPAKPEAPAKAGAPTPKAATERPSPSAKPEAPAKTDSPGKAPTDKARATERAGANPGMAESQASAPTPPAAEPIIQAPMRPAPPPKPLGNAGKDFKAGDFVVYPTHGVGQVQGIEDVPVAGQSLKVIVVTFEENRMTLKVPMAKAASSGLRKLASDKVMGEAMDTLRGRARIKRTMWSRRAQEYEQKINSGDPIAIAEVVRDLHRNAGQPDQSFSERQIYELALDRLAAEVGALDRTDKATATQKLLDTLKTVEKEK
ncbi:CarD family transcriptional regulator [Pararoseomonas baculiformis]|nr:CarD family transcriptional regulator [Pararoseomonas baculiformis]